MAMVTDTTSEIEGSTGDMVHYIAPLETSSTTIVYTSKPRKLNEDGFLFPYFDGMLEPSRDYAFQQFVNYFSKCIANSEQDMCQLLTVLRPGFRSLYTTPQGQEISHIMYGIDMACKSGAKLHPFVSNRQYLGFALTSSDSDFKLFTGSQIRTSIPAKELSILVMELDRHRAAIDEIRELLLTLSDDIPDIDTLSSSSRILAKTVYGITLTTEQKDVITELLNKTSFGDVYMEFNTTNIIRALNLMASNSWDWPEAPYYLKGGIVHSDDLMVRVLASFGTRAPIVNSISGENMSFDLRQPPPVNLEGETSIRYLPIASGSITQAAASYRRILQNRALHIAIGRKGKSEWSNVKDKTIVGKGDTNFRPLYDAIRALANSAPTTGPRGVKRANEAEDPSRKKRKDIETQNISTMSSLL